MGMRLMRLRGIASRRVKRVCSDLEFIRIKEGTCMATMSVRRNKYQKVGNSNILKAIRKVR